MSRKKPKPVKRRMTVWMWIGIGLVLLLAAAAVFWMVYPRDRSGIPAEISVQEAYAKREAGAFILDVRQPEEWEQVHIPGATLIPLGDLPDRLSEVPGDQEVVVVCRSGNRSQEGRDILKKAGYEQVTSMKGGIKEWQAAGYPTLSGP